MSKNHKEFTKLSNNYLNSKCNEGMINVMMASRNMPVFNDLYGEMTPKSVNQEPKVKVKKR